MKSFPISATSDRLWNLKALLEHLRDNQGKPIDLVVVPEAIDLRSLGVYDFIDLFEFPCVVIHTCNPFEHHPRYIIQYHPNYWLTKPESPSPELHTWNEKKIFYCLFGRPTASRLSIAAYLQKNHKNISHVHFSTAADDDELEKFELDKALSYDSNNIAAIGDLIKTMPLCLAPSTGYTAFNGYDFSDPLTRFYADILVDIVVESHVMGDTFFVTEKTLRPMWLKKPFVVFGSKNYLDYMHQMGFRTFSDFWSEDYDGYQGRERLRRMLSVIDHIAHRSTRELQEMYWDMTYTLEHNYNLLKTQTYSTDITRLL